MYLSTGETPTVLINDNNGIMANITVMNGAAIGTVLLITLTLLFMFVMLCVKKKKCRRVHYYKDIISVTNDAHENTDKKPKSDKCDDFLHCSEVKLTTTNCLYEPTKIKTADVSITPNPSYTVTPNSVQIRKEPEYQYDYIQTHYLGSTTAKETHNNDATNPSSDDNVNIDLNPSYSLASQDIILRDNPSYVKLLQ